MRPRGRPRVVVLTAGEQPPGLADVESAADVEPVSAAGLPAALPGADVLLVWEFLSTAVREAWPRTGEPSWVHVASAGVDRLLFPELVGSAATLTNSRGVFEEPLAEYVLALVLAHAKQLPETLALQARREWRHRDTRRVADTHALVAGAGPIGRAIARRLAALDITVRVLGRTPRRDPELGEIHGSDELPELLPGTDWVICVAPLTEQTHGMFDAAAFERMAAGSYFVNVGRGELVVTKDLVSALCSGHLGGAALDVFTEEPLPADDELWDVPGLLVSPHMSADTVGWLDHLSAVFTDNFARWLSGRPLRNVVDKRLGYVPTSVATGADPRTEMT